MTKTRSHLLLTAEAAKKKWRRSGVCHPGIQGLIVISAELKILREMSFFIIADTANGIFAMIAFIKRRRNGKRRRFLICSNSTNPTPMN